MKSICLFCFCRLCSFKKSVLGFHLIFPPSSQRTLISSFVDELQHTQLDIEVGGHRLNVKSCVDYNFPGWTIVDSGTSSIVLPPKVFESFAKEGFLLGHASVVCVPEDYPIMKFIEHLFDFASYESCGKCFPCRLGTKRGHELSQKALTSDYKIDKKLFDDLLTTLEQGSLCAHGGGIPLPIRNALQYFEHEIKEYFI